MGVTRFTLPQVGIGICTKSAAEATKRGANFSHELDFVAANIIMALVADFCLVWLPAPRANWRCSVPVQKPVRLWCLSPRTFTGTL